MLADHVRSTGRPALPEKTRYGNGHRGRQPRWPLGLPWSSRRAPWFTTPEQGHSSGKTRRASWETWRVMRDDSPPTDAGWWKLGRLPRGRLGKPCRSRRSAHGFPPGRRSRLADRAPVDDRGILPAGGDRDGPGTRGASRRQRGGWGPWRSALTEPAWSSPRPRACGCGACLASGSGSRSSGSTGTHRRIRRSRNLSPELLHRFSSRSGVAIC